jgi:GNAT superfamily N-acetyltransferase
MAVPNRATRRELRTGVVALTLHGIVQTPPQMPDAIAIRPATRADVPALLELIGALADYERLRGELRATPELLERHLFGSRPAAEAILARRDGAAVGYALFFPTFSTFLAKPGIWLEDLFVPERHRRLGAGYALLSHLAALALERGCPRVEWLALDWNELALGFYERLGAERLSEWELHRLQGPALERVASGGTRGPHVHPGQ